MSKYVQIFFDEIVAETEKALLIRFKDEFDKETEEWVPLSQIEDADEHKVGDRFKEISMTEWIAKQKGLFDERRHY